LLIVPERDDSNNAAKASSQNSKYALWQAVRARIMEKAH
jgi:hypothetical protein